MSTSTIETNTARPARTGRDRLLRLALQFDAVATGAVGSLLLVGGPWLDDLLGAPAALLQPVGLFLVAYAAVLGVAGSRPTISRPAARATVALNALWVVGSAILVAAGPLPLTGLGVAFAIAQAAAVALFADLQFLGLRKARLGTR